MGLLKDVLHNLQEIAGFGMYFLGAKLLCMKDALRSVSKLCFHIYPIKRHKLQGKGTVPDKRTVSCFKSMYLYFLKENCVIMEKILQLSSVSYA